MSLNISPSAQYQFPLSFVNYILSPDRLCFSPIFIITNKYILYIYHECSSLLLTKSDCRRKLFTLLTIPSYSWS